MDKVEIGVFGIEYKHLDKSAYISPECGSRCVAEDYMQQTISELEDYFACGFKYVYAEETFGTSTIYRSGRGKENKSDLFYLLDVALEYEKIHGKGSCPVLVCDHNMVCAQDGRKNFADVKDDIAALYHKLRKEYSSVFAGYMLRDEPARRFFDRFTEVYDYVYNELGGQDLVYLVSLLPTDGTIIGEPSLVPEFLISESGEQLKVDEFKAFLTGDKYDGYLNKNVYGYIDNTFYSEYVYYLDKLASMYREKNIRNVLFGCDIYPYRNVDEGFRSYYIACIQAVSDICKKYDYKMFLTIQSYAETWIFTRFTNEAFISLQAFTAVAYGCKHLSYFTYMEHFLQHDGRYTVAMLMQEETDGKKRWQKTEYYDWVKNVNSRLGKYEILTAFEHKGSFCFMGDNPDLLKKQRCVIPYEDEHFGVISSRHDVLVGCFEHKEKGVKAYLLVNYAYPALEESTEVFVEVKKGVLFDENGKAIEDRKFTIECGGAKLLFVSSASLRLDDETEYINFAKTI